MCALLLTVLFTFGAVLARADGIPILKGRYTGPATLVAISSEQLREIGVSRRLQLTQAQKAQLLASGYPAPSVLEVLVPRHAGFHCTCHTTNIAIWLTRSVVQVPHAFLRSDGDPAIRDPESATPAREFPPPPLRLIADVEGRLSINGHIIDLAEVDAFIQNTQPRVTHIVVLMPPLAADIPVSRKQRNQIRKTMHGLSEKYDTDYGYFE